MSIGIRKLLLAGVIFGILALANTGAIVACLQEIGIVPLVSSGRQNRPVVGR